MQTSASLSGHNSFEAHSVARGCHAKARLWLNVRSVAYSRALLHVGSVLCSFIVVVSDSSKTIT